MGRKEQQLLSEGLVVNDRGFSCTTQATVSIYSSTRTLLLFAIGQAGVLLGERGKDLQSASKLHWIQQKLHAA